MFNFDYIKDLFLKIHFKYWKFGKKNINIFLYP